MFDFIESFHCSWCIVQNICKHYRYWTPLPLAWMFSIVSSGDADGRVHRACNSVARLMLTLIKDSWQLAATTVQQQAADVHGLECGPLGSLTADYWESVLLLPPPVVSHPPPPRSSQRIRPVESQMIFRATAWSAPPPPPPPRESAGGGGGGGGGAGGGLGEKELGGGKSILFF
jgi:hypothetical protein